MQYIIFGAGKTGRKAAMDLGLERVDFFASNFPFDKGGNVQWVLGRKVISFEEMKKRIQIGDYIIVVASENYYIDLEKQLQECGIEKFFVYHENDSSELWQLFPKYYLFRYVHTLDYAKVLSLYHIEKYKRIAIYGGDIFLPYMICEISIQNHYDNIAYIIPNENSINNNIQNMGIELQNLDNVWDDIDCLIVNSKWNQTDVRSLLDLVEHKFDVVDIYDVDKFEPSYYHSELERFKDIHKGKRVFVIGNGPSLRSEDLDRLHENGEICLAANKIHKIYPKTEWRPNYLCFIDAVGISSAIKEIEAFDGIVFLTDVYNRFGTDFPMKSDVNIVHQAADVIDLYYPNKPGFSIDITKGVGTSFTVTYFGIQLAAYMGAGEIYLLGVDNTLALNTYDSKHFTDDYDNFISSNSRDYAERDMVLDELLKVQRLHLVHQGYRKAEEFSKTHGFRIYNATRGGKLDAFERVEFDSLF